LSATGASAAGATPLGAGGWEQEVVCVRDQQQVGDGTAVPATGRTEPEGGAGRRTVGGAGGEAPRPAGRAGAARHLERRDDPIAGPERRDGRAGGCDLADELVPHRERTGEQPRLDHGGVEIAAGDSQGPDNGIGRPRLGLGYLAPRHLPRFHVGQLLHEPSVLVLHRPAGWRRSMCTFAPS
jgi:hypothetical protein